MFFIYILRTSGNTLYVGQTNNLEKRLKEHEKKSSRSAKYTRSFSSVELVYTEKYTTRSLVLKREAVLKKLSHKQKESLISNSNVLT